MPEILTIPLNSDYPSFKIRTVLEDIEIVLLLNWNTRAERWNISIMNASEEPLVMGLPLHIDMELIERFEIEGLPPGKLVLYDMSGKSIECGRDDLGDRCHLLYQASV